MINDNNGRISVWNEYEFDVKTIGVLKVRMMLFSSPKFNFEKIGSSDKGREWLEYREEYLTLEMPS